MGIIIDIILIAIVLLSAFLGYKKGLVKLGAKLFAGIIAIILTIIVYKPVSGMIIKNTPGHPVCFVFVALAMGRNETDGR